MENQGRQKQRDDKMAESYATMNNTRQVLTNCHCNFTYEVHMLQTGPYLISAQIKLTDVEICDFLLLLFLNIVVYI